MTIILQEVAISIAGRVRLDLLHSSSVSRRATASRSPLERAVADNIRLDPISARVTGSLSASPLGPISTQLGAAGSIIRRDLRELKKLQQIQARREPVILVLPQAVFPPMVMSIDETHPGGAKVDLSLTFEEIRIVSPLTAAGVIDLDAIQAGAQSSANAGAQPAAAVDAPTDLGAGGLGA